MKTFKLIHLMWILLPIVLVALGVCTITVFIILTEHIQRDMNDTFEDTYKVLIEHVQDKLHLLLHTNALSYNVARLLTSVINMNVPSFSTIETKVAPQLFMTFTMLASGSQISYVAKNGFLFSYYWERNQTYATFSNISHSLNDFSTYSLYSQQINETNGEKFGDVILSHVQPNESQWFHDALNGKSGYASWGVSWGMEKPQMLFFTAPIHDGVISIGVEMKDFTNYVLAFDLHGAQLYLFTRDGHFLEYTKPLDSIYDLTYTMVPIHKVGQNNIMHAAKYIDGLCNRSNHGSLSTIDLDIWAKKYMFDCAFFDVGGIQLVTAVVFPFKGVLYLFQGMKIIIILLLSILLLVLIFGSYGISQHFRRLQEQEVFLRVNLINLKDALLQAERKSMNKSLAFASASHDVRTSLVAITGLIDICRGEIQQKSELKLNLDQMNACASKLLGIVNSILNMSKVEAGKMQLEEVEFDMSQVLEESVDLCCIAALNKGLEIVWDPCDFSILKLSNVKGDCRRVRQILDNLLSNAMKFTSSGHIVLRVWAKKSSLENFKQSSRHNSQYSFCSISRWLCKIINIHSDANALNNAQHDPNLIEFVFEIEDTGIGIPKEKRASIFENYVQVKESSNEEHEGTGLGLGIVQSFVRLMGGEINIQDKDHGERGTCFRFNIFLKSTETTFSHLQGEAKDSCTHQMSKCSLSEMDYVMTQSSIQSMKFSESFNVGGIRALLLVQGDQTKRILQIWMESIGMKVWLVDNWEFLYPMVEKIKCFNNGSGKFDMISKGSSLNITKSSDFSTEKDVSYYFKDEDGQILPVSTKDVSKKRIKDSSACILILIDISCCGDLSNISSFFSNLSKEYRRKQLKFVWLVNPDTRSDEVIRLKENSCDLVLKKPIHGSRLHSLLKLIQEFGGSNDVQQSWKLNSMIESKKSFTLGSPVDSKKSFAGMKFLLVEDNHLLRRINSLKISKLGGNVEFAENGLEALTVIKRALQEASHRHEESNQAQGFLKCFCYDVILMDCEMPIMDGYEATRKIREEEKKYGIHIPIIALTAHETSEAEEKTILSGMDLHLNKSLDNEHLLEAIRHVRQN